MWLSIRRITVAPLVILCEHDIFVEVYTHMYWIHVQVEALGNTFFYSIL